MKSIILVGTVSNVAKKLERDLKKLNIALQGISSVSFFVVESDSTDNTLDILKKLSKIFPNFKYQSMGSLKAQFPDRVDRIRFCRNVYVDYIRSLDLNCLPDYTVVADLDGINSSINMEAFKSCFTRDDWDVVVSNQTRGYYDIYALRAKNWQETDCFADLNFHKAQIPVNDSSRLNLLSRIKFLLYYDHVRHIAIYSKMRKIKKYEPWIEICSGFGGLAIYKTKIFKEYDYSKQVEGDGESEHVTLHQKLNKDNKKIFINPRFINSKWNTYNVNKFFLVRQSRRLFYESGLIYSLFRRISHR
jgi:hypothetical protein